jgi:polyphosphate glucokinase
MTDPQKILVVDIGGTNVKALATGQTERRKAPSGPDFTPAKMAETVRRLAEGWEYEAVTIGFPGVVGPDGPRAEPGNLGPGWVGFDYAAAFGVPVKVINDAAMQALGGYAGGRMLFLGLGTGIGSVLIARRNIMPLELGGLRFTRKRILFDYLGREGLKRRGLAKWRAAVAEAVAMLQAAFMADYVLLGGGNAKKIGEPPPGVRLGSNQHAFRGGYRLWGLDMLPTQTPDGRQVEPPEPADREWRML